MSAATSFSVRPGRSHSPIRRCTRSIAAPAAAQRGDLGGALAHPQLGDRLAGQRQLGRRARSPGGQTRARPACGSPPRAPARPPAAGRRQRRRDRRSRPKPAISTGRRPARPARRAAPARDQQERVRLGRHHQAGQPLQRQRLIAGQIAQVGAGRDQQRVHPRVGGGLSGESEALSGVERGGGSSTRVGHARPR